MNSSAQAEIHAPARVIPAPRAAWGGVWRLTLARFIAPRQLLVFLILTAIFVLITVTFNRPRRPFGGYWDWMCAFYLTVLLPIISFMSGAAAVRDELKAGTVDFVFTRPIRRWVFIVFRYLAHVACLQVGYLLLLTCLLAIGFARGVPNLSAALPTVVIAQFATVTAFVALGFFAAVATSRYMVVGLVYAACFETLGFLPTQLSRFSITQVVRSIMHPYWLRSPSVVLQAPVFESLVLLFAIATALVAIAAAIFSWREFSGGANADL